MKKSGVVPKMPPNPMPHIFNRLVEIGLTDPEAMGVGLSWKSINEWCIATSVDLDPWERRLIQHLSKEYVAESRRAELDTCPPPWRAEVTDREIELEKAGLDSLLG